MITRAELLKLSPNAIIKMYGLTNTRTHNNPLCKKYGKFEIYKNRTVIFTYYHYQHCDSYCELHDFLVTRYSPYFTSRT